MGESPNHHQIKQNSVKEETKDNINLHNFYTVNPGKFMFTTEKSDVPPTTTDINENFEETNYIPKVIIYPNPYHQLF